MLCREMLVYKVARIPRVSDGVVWRVIDHQVEKVRNKEDFSAVRTVGHDPPHDHGHVPARRQAPPSTAVSLHHKMLRSGLKATGEITSNYPHNPEEHPKAKLTCQRRNYPFLSGI